VGKNANDNTTQTSDATEKALFCTSICEEIMTEKGFKNDLIKKKVI